MQCRPLLPSRRWLWRALGLLALCLGLFSAYAAAAEDRIQIKIVGGLAGVTQYNRFEAPFWTEEVPRLTGGRVHAEIAPFDRSGIRGPETLPLMRLGVVPFGTILLALAASDEPELNAIDLPVLNPDIATLRQTVRLLRPRLENLMRDRYGVKVLAIYVYPAQVVFCRQAFASFSDLRGRRVRVSSVSQSELFEALGATPVVTPFAEIPAALRNGVVECAVTGSMSGNALGLPTVTTHVSRQAISWGMSVFAANNSAWAALPPDIRAVLQQGLGTLQESIWQASAEETEEGFACNGGRPDCVNGTRGTMVVLDDTARDRARRDQLLRDAVLPGWVRRCGTECAEVWNATVGPVRGIMARPD
ncbi:TRAP transporter substrate-binding protein [Belnapia sp. T6]|uniref:TRAP transporter substrate-binding protein n=1 Tax=Belnapia mucosa TaxID=2804532 RepID=A0ABS1UY99_9PROT|nr:TRAP transporter substrate-binding protein [Belnapia mucosa]MBL6453771.1 TRAP transporter substrate-binding protein [Belnapia mucosa]